jgi:PAS domain S-box-containing protein
MKLSRFRKQLMKEPDKSSPLKVSESKSPGTTLKEELIASEVRYRRLFESAKDGILILDAESGKIIDVNPFLINLLGFSKKKFVEMELWEIGFFRDIVANKDKFLELKKQEYVRYDNLPLETAEGRRINVEFVSNVYLENNHKIIQCNIRDITERKKKEAALINSEMRQQALFQTIPDLIWLKDKEGIYLSCNKMFERFFGACEADIIGKSDFDFIDRKLADSFRDNDRNAMAAGKPTINEEWITFADDGHRAFLETIKSPMYDTQNQLIGVLGIGRDITMRKEAQNALLESELKYRSFFENNMDAILLTSCDGKTLSANQAACDMFGYSSDELVKLGRSGVEDKNDTRLSILIKERDLRGNAKGEVTFRHKDGTRFPAEISSSIFKNKEGHSRGSMIIHDITERKRVENELILAKELAEKSDKLKSAFLANMSHEIRTPMNGILGFTELLKEPMLTGEEQKEFIGYIEKSGERMLNLINDIISISKVESGQLEVSLSTTNINEMVEEICLFFRHEAELKTISLRFSDHLPPESAIISTDREKVNAILTNLVKNAIKFTKSGSIEIGYNYKAGYLEFYIKDTGIGIRPELKELIFERFRQGSESLIRNYEGAGLGLSISKGFVEILGGKIWVEANSDISLASQHRTGSTFFFTIPYIPLKQEKDNLLKIIRKAEDQNQNKNLKILIAEDDEISELLISINVGRISNNVMKVRSGSEAIEFCRNNPDIDLVLMDIKMPLMDGYEATRQIRKFNKHVIIIAQTAYGLNGDREEAIDAGCNEYISKPVNLATLNNLIKSYFQ